MKRLILVLLSLMILGCVQKKQQTSPETQQAIPDGHTSQNSLDWNGTYSGVLPCASCEGIETSLTLNDDDSYSLRMTYLGEDALNRYDAEGSFSWNEAGNTITLENEEAPNQYFVGENYIAKLDSNGHRLTGDLANRYILQKDQ